MNLKLLPAGGENDVEAHQIGSNGATGGAAGAVADESFGHAVGLGWIPDDFRRRRENMPTAQFLW